MTIFESNLAELGRLWKEATPGDWKIEGATPNGQVAHLFHRPELHIVVDHRENLSNAIFDAKLIAAFAAKYGPMELVKPEGATHVFSTSVGDTGWYIEARNSDRRIIAHFGANPCTQRKAEKTRNRAFGKEQT